MARSVFVTNVAEIVGYHERIFARRYRRFADQEYHGRPVPGFGDVNARLLLVGLAPAAHGANRTGRMFTGDPSGDWLARVMYRHGFASRPTSLSADDGLVLRDAYVAAVEQCVPPATAPPPRI